MKLRLLRYFSDETHTKGLLFLDKIFVAHTLEDKYSSVKVHGKTRIPEGSYIIKLREERTPLTIKYRKNFPWFKYHLELQNVEEFDYIYLHVGNTQKDTEGCILIGEGSEKNSITNSVIAFTELYNKIYPIIEKGEEVIIEIVNINPLFLKIKEDELREKL